MKGIRFTISFLFVLMSCGKQINYGGYSPQEERPICHLDYELTEWYGEDETLPLWLVYEGHIGMHPNDYWGKCKEEDIKERKIPKERPEWVKELMKGRRWRRE